MGKIKYFLGNIIRKPFIFIIVMVQIAITTTILIPAITVFLDYYDNYKLSENNFSDKEIYTINLDFNSFNKCIDNSFDSNKLYEMYNFLNTNENFKFLYQMNSNIIIEDFSSNDEFYYEVGENKYLENPYYDVYGNYSNINAVYINQVYYESMGLEVEEGRDFTSLDYEDSDVTSVILGGDYKGIYSIGDSFTYFDYFTKKVKEMKVVGILKRNLAFYNNGDIETFNKYVISPSMKVSSKNNNYDYLSSWVGGTLIETDDINKTIELIKDKAEEEDIGYYNVESCAKSIKVYLDDSLNRFINSLRTSILILIFVLISVITIQLNDINNRMKEYGIHLLSGARKIDIILRNFYTIICYVFCGVGLGYYIENIRNNNGIANSDNLKILFILIIIFGVFIGLIEIILYKKINKIQINNIIRGVENESNRNE